VSRSSVDPSTAIPRAFNAGTTRTRKKGPYINRHWQKPISPLGLQVFEPVVFLYILHFAKLRAGIRTKAFRLAFLESVAAAYTLTAVFSSQASCHQEFPEAN
jgi:hypothetical protein